MNYSTSKLVDRDSLYEEHQFVVENKQSIRRLDKYLLQRIANISRSRIQNAIKAGSVTVNDEEVKPNYRVRPGDVISVLMPRPLDEACRVIPDDIPLDIVYEDDDVLVVNKPAGMVVHPGVGHYRRTLVNALAHYFQGKADIPIMDGNPENRPFLVHRIDKDTSGLLVVAKNDYAMAHLGKQFFRHTIHRRYYALVWGEPEQDEGTIRGHVGRDLRNRQRMAVFPEGDHGKWAVTHYRVLERLYYVSLVECRLETGRTHQIRVHMRHIGHPLFNDPRYGGDRIRKGTVFSKYKQFVDNCFRILPRHALHAKELGFEHPTTGEFMKFTSELPDDMQAALAQWRTYVQAKKEQIERERDG